MIIQGRTFPVKQIIVLATSLPRPVELTQEFFDRISHYNETRKSRNWTTANLTPRLAAWLLRSHTALSNFLEDILQPTKSKMSPTSNLGLQL